MKQTNEIKKLLAKHLDCKVSDIDFDNYEIYTDSEADNACEEYIRESICFFNTPFLMAHVKENITAECIDALKTRYEESNHALIALIDDFDHFVSDAISADGRGHVLSGYDGEEIELQLKDGTYVFAYRTN